MLQEVYRKQREATVATQRRNASSFRCKSNNDFVKSTDIKDNVSILCFSFDDKIFIENRKISTT